MRHTLLYGGTFDPLHHGHLITCMRARELVGADRVLLMPARISPHKLDTATGASGDQRLAMIRAAIAGIQSLDVDDRELFRPGPSYTIDTLEELRREHPDERFTLLIGADQLPKLHAWHRAGDILAGDVAVLQRSALRQEEGLGAVQAHFGKAAADKLRACMLETPRIDISATDIRQRVRGGLSIDFLVAPGVAEMIRSQHLYQPGTNAD